MASRHRFYATVDGFAAGRERSLTLRPTAAVPRRDDRPQTNAMRLTSDPSSRSRVAAERDAANGDVRRPPPFESCGSGVVTTGLPTVRRNCTIQAFGIGSVLVMVMVPMASSSITASETFESVSVMVLAALAIDYHRRSVTLDGRVLDLTTMTSVLGARRRSVQLVKETRPPIAATRERPRRVDYEYERAGTASVFLFSEPLAGWRQATARDRRTKADCAVEVAALLEGRYAECPKVTVVCDNLNTSGQSS